MDNTGKNKWLIISFHVHIFSIKSIPRLELAETTKTLTMPRNRRPRVEYAAGLRPAWQWREESRVSHFPGVGVILRLGKKSPFLGKENAFCTNSSNSLFTSQEKNRIPCPPLTPSPDKEKGVAWLVYPNSWRGMHAGESTAFHSKKKKGRQGDLFSGLPEQTVCAVFNEDIFNISRRLAASHTAWKLALDNF